MKDILSAVTLLAASISIGLAVALIAIGAASGRNPNSRSRVARRSMDHHKRETP